MVTRHGNAVILKPGLAAKNLHLLFSPHSVAPYLRACECYHSPDGQDVDLMWAQCLIGSGTSDYSHDTDFLAYDMHFSSTVLR
jgi:hypothetical protein